MGPTSMAQMMSASLALTIDWFAGEAGHMATVAMVLLAIVLAAGVCICVLRGRREQSLNDPATQPGSACRSITGCGRR